MPNYRRAWQPGGTFFLTLATHRRMRWFADAVARRCLHDAIARVRRDFPFSLVAAALLPDHLHLIMELPADDTNFSIRISAIKGHFTRRWFDAGGSCAQQSASRQRQGYAGIWQKRFWEHAVRDSDDLNRCLDYIHYNPVKHALATCPHTWRWTTFARFVLEGKYADNWQCACSGAMTGSPPADIPGAEMN